MLDKIKYILKDNILDYNILLKKLNKFDELSKITKLWHVYIKLSAAVEDASAVMETTNEIDECVDKDNMVPGALNEKHTLDTTNQEL